ncbi:MAG TPA: hypothetical protein PKY81_09795 [bacterium]|nr:hypothetical protein [bacterium]
MKSIFLFLIHIFFFIISFNVLLFAGTNREFSKWQSVINSDSVFKITRLDSESIIDYKIINFSEPVKHFKPKWITWVKSSHFSAAAQFLDFHSLFDSSVPQKVAVAGLSTFIYKCICSLEGKPESYDISGGISSYLQSKNLQLDMKEIVLSSSDSEQNPVFSFDDYKNQIDNNNPVIITFITKKKLSPLHRINGYSVFAFGYVLLKDNQKIIIAYDFVSNSKQNFLNPDLQNIASFYLWENDIFDCTIFLFKNINNIIQNHESSNNLNLFNSGSDINQNLSSQSNSAVSPAVKLSHETGFFKLNFNNNSLYFFYTPNCPECVEVCRIIENKLKCYPYVSLIKYNIFEPENIELLNILYKAYNVPFEDWNNKFVVFYKNKFFNNKSDIQNSLQNLLASPVSKTILKPANPIEFGLKSHNLKNIFLSFGFWSVISAGFIDGINPCAFATLVFFIAYLNYLKRSRKQIFFTGVLFSTGIFIAYFSIGAGFLKFIKTVSFLPVLTKSLYFSTSAICFFLGLLSFIDAYYAKFNKRRKIILQLPSVLKLKIHNLIRNQKFSKYYYFSAFISGLLISVIEFVCTGQMYLPVIMYAVKIPELSFNAYLMLGLYVFAFIIPLFVLLVFTLLGFSFQNKLSEFSEKNVFLSKIIIGLVFILFSLLLLNSIV